MDNFKIGNTAYILESNCIAREVLITGISGGLYLVKFADKDGAIRVKRHRLFPTKKSAEASIPPEKKPEPELDYSNSPYYYDH